MSSKSAGRAKKAGYKNIKVMLAGEPGWVKAGYPTYASTGFVSKGNIVLVDLRSVKKSETSRIPGSVTIPYDTLDDNINNIPKKAPVVLYSDNEKETFKAVKKLRKEGINKVSLVYGDLGRWLNTVGNFESGSVVTKIHWTRKLGKGEVAVADFKKAVSGSSGILLLDVRTRDEAAEGMFAGAVNIPLAELTKRTSELSVDKKIYIHSSTGSRADMAQKQLKKDGYKAFFLVASVECADKECEIEE